MFTYTHDGNTQEFETEAQRDAYAAWIEDYELRTMQRRQNEADRAAQSARQMGLYAYGNAIANQEELR